MNKLIIIGAGQYGQVTKEIAESMNNYKKIDFLDDSNETAIGKIEDYMNFKKEYEFIVAIGNPAARNKIISELETNGCVIAKIISPKAHISNSSIIEYGCIIEPYAIINAHTTIEKSSIICCGAIINHNSIVHSFCNINCGAIIQSNQKLPKFTKMDYGEIFKKE